MPSTRTVGVLVIPAREAASVTDAVHPAYRSSRRWIVVDGRRWAADPELPEQVRARLLHHLATARSAVRTRETDHDDAAVTAARARVGGSQARSRRTRYPRVEQDSDARRERWTAALDELDPRRSSRDAEQLGRRATAGPAAAGANEITPPRPV